MIHSFRTRLFWSHYSDYAPAMGEYHEVLHPEWDHTMVGVWLIGSALAIYGFLAIGSSWRRVVWHGLWDVLADPDEYSREWVRWVLGYFAVVLGVIALAAGDNWSEAGAHLSAAEDEHLRAAKVHAVFLAVHFLLFCLFAYFKDRGEPYRRLHPVAMVLLIVSFVASAFWLVVCSGHS